MSVLAVAETLDRMGDRAEPVVERARTEFNKPPSVAQLYGVLGEIGSDVPERPALPVSDFVSEMPQEVREKFRALHDKWADEDKRDYEAEDAAWRERKEKMMDGKPGAGARIEVEADHPCDRCEHPMSEHASPLVGMRCSVGHEVYRKQHQRNGRVIAYPCPCDGFVPRPA